MPVRPLRIGNAHGFWGDRLQAAAEMLAAEPDLDFLTLDFLAEVSMSILAAQQQRDPGRGYARDFLDVVASLTPYWRDGGRCRVVTNAGGLNPEACAQACRDALRAAGCGHIQVASVSGDDVLEAVRGGGSLSDHLDTGLPIQTVAGRLTTAHAYLGARPVAEALQRGAGLVVTGRVADPSLTVAPCVDHFGWSWEQWDQLAGATVAGHLIECGTQVSGGISTDWLQLPDAGQIGFPIVEVSDDGSCIVTKPRGSGGRVNRDTVREQLLYEIGDPSSYLSPDVTVSFLTLDLHETGENRVQVRGAAGRPPPPTLKVSATYDRGFRAAGQLTVCGADAVAKARRAGKLVLQRLEQSGASFRESTLECVGGNDTRWLPRAATDTTATEVVLRIAVADDSRERVEQFARAIMSLVTAGPPGTTGYAAGRPRVHPAIGFWPCLIPGDQVNPVIRLHSSSEAPLPATGFGEPSPQRRTESPEDTVLEWDEEPLSASEPIVRGTLADIALARSGDKGRHANLGVIARHADGYNVLRSQLTCQRVAAHLGIAEERVQRFELPNLAALNFVIRDILDNSLRLDSQGKALGQAVLQMPWPPAKET